MTGSGGDWLLPDNVQLVNDSGNGWTARIVLLSLLVTLQSCSEDWAKKLELGVLVPNARLQVTLNEPTSKWILYNRFQDAARKGGFSYFGGNAITPIDEDRQLAAGGFSFYPTADRSVLGQYTIDFVWPHDATEPSSFEFVFHNSSTNEFTEAEWLMFRDWQTKVLPAVFPDATIIITRHPAEFTDSAEVSRIAKATGMPLQE